MLAIWVRKTVPWDDEEAFVAQIPEGFRRKVEVWNETFTIAELNHAAVRGAVRLE